MSGSYRQAYGQRRVIKPPHRRVAPWNVADGERGRIDCEGRDVAEHGQDRGAERRVVRRAARSDDVAEYSRE